MAQHDLRLLSRSFKDGKISRDEYRRSRHLILDKLDDDTIPFGTAKPTKNQQNIQNDAGHKTAIDSANKPISRRSLYLLVGVGSVLAGLAALAFWAMSP